MKIFSREQLALIDRRTITEEPVSEIDLMERASKALADWLVTYYAPSTKIAVFAGPGNNGGDALAVARILSGLNYSIDLYLPALGHKRSEASQINLERLKEMSKIPVIELNDQTEFPSLTHYNLLLDGLYGSGLNRPLEGYAALVIDWINQIRN